MNKIEAMAYLIACKPLAQRLFLEGINIELSDEDRVILANFRKVQLDEWLRNQDILNQVGLSLADIGILSLMVAELRTQRMRQQHASGEQID